ncbi:TetR/AcrR family transcriptional regulator [Arthrobacter sp. CAU 1506]|uniref:TetR/AcrR family transcriptional regulator n=1 Tax=Arthrobacter sp. CAU 1506 TaxID=2560052 RepID=UPI0010ACE011|nr:TetR/AcrR family transcriptional regulator [Arthrobacter sp. CAU 1506]TJY72524.1 TetR/AcrR family transcriptional regulator [Arthrobacter sp. CAU 1506]
MAGTPRERAREQTISDIVRIGREQLSQVGAAALSLRAVARELGVVSSAVYRYVGSRDELLTLLVVEAYNELGEAVEHAVAAAGDRDAGARFRALCRSVREWGLREPARYALLFGSPVPGYQAPAERTTGPGIRVVVALVRMIDDAYRAGELTFDPEGAGVYPARHKPGRQGSAQQETALPGPLHHDLAAIRREFGLAAPDDLIARGTLVWTALFGAVSFEVFGQYGRETFTDAGSLFEHHLDVLANILGLP